jgi:hypothetical protein
VLLGQVSSWWPCCLQWATVSTCCPICGHSDLAPACQVGEEEHIGRAGAASLLLSSLGCGAMLKVSAVVILQFKFHASFVLPNFSVDTLALHSSSTGWRPWNNAPVLLLHCHPLRTIRPSPPTTFAELQWGEPHSEAFGTGTWHHWVIFQSQWGWSCCPFQATISTHHLMGSQSRFGTSLSSRGRGTRGQDESGKPVVC